MIMKRSLLLILLGFAVAPATVALPFASLLVQEEVDSRTPAELVADGLQLREAGKAAEAEPLFSRAYAEEPGNVEARFWMIRTWVDLERVNDALNACDEWIAEGKSGADIDYLVGMAFHKKAIGYLATGVDGGTISMSFGDATSFLKSATQADPDRFADAFYPLAEASWHSQDLETARTAIGEATTREPNDAQARFLLGRIVMSQYVVARGDGTPQEAVDALLQTGLDAFLKTADILGKPKESDRISLLAQAWVQAAFCYAWKAEHDKLIEAATNALGWNPGDVDFSWVQSQMKDNAELIACLQAGGDAYAKRYGDKDPGDATLRWWLGWAYFSELKYPEAEREFTDSVNKFPSYVNCWFYIALSRYHGKNYDGAIEAFNKHWEVAPVNAVESLGGNKNSNLAILDYLVGQCAQKGDNISAAVLSEMQGEVAQNVDRYWNNVGLFYRDGGEILARTNKKENVELALGYYEKSWAGYQRALAIDPENPAYLNDGAVLLHYYLDRELERAAEMYRQATVNAEKLLADENLSQDKRDLFKIALRDSKNNLKLLEKKLEKGSAPR